MNSKKKIIVSVTNDLYTDQRVRKVCEFLVNHNYDLTLVGRRFKTSAEMPKTAYKTRRFRLWFTKGPLFYANYNIRLFFYLLFSKADVLLANDLDTLYANHWARKFKKNCRLIYDSHEYYCGTPELVNRPRVQNFWRKIEKRCLPKADKMYAVNESVANLYREEYGREVRVVRNITDANFPEFSATKEQLGLPEDKRIIIMQGAGINIDRGAEEMIKAIQLVENAVLIIVGDGDVVPIIKQEVRGKGLENKVLFFGKRPYNELMNFTALSDLGVSMDKDTNINYRFSLPNKIFDYIHAGIPLFVSDLTEVKKIVEGYDVGVICPSHDPKIIAKELNDLLDDKVRMAELKANTKNAAKELNWATETIVLKEIFGE